MNLITPIQILTREANEDPLRLPVSIAFRMSDGEESHIECHHILRVLNGKRVTFEANYLGQKVLAKLFCSTAGTERWLEREKRGAKLMIDAGLPAAKLLAECRSMDNAADCLLFEFVDNAKDVEALWYASSPSEKRSLLEDLFKLIAVMHEKGLYQKDLHLGNFMLKDGALVIVDAGSIEGSSATPLSQKQSLDNIALLIAQFTLDEQVLCLEILPAYYDARAWDHHALTDFDVNALVRSTWEKRVSKHIEKRFRDCTDVVCIHTFRSFVACARRHYSSAMTELLSDPDAAIRSGETIKAGNSATVAKVMLDGRKLIIKRYNIKGLWHRVKRSLQPSRAWVSWRNAHLLQLIGIPTPRPVAIVEKRIGPFRSCAYYISECVEAEELSDVYQKRSPEEGELNQLRNIFELMRMVQLSHGDLKARNLMLNNGEITVIDLDAMKRHDSADKFDRAFEKDKKRFLKNWDGRQDYQMFLGLFNVERD